MKTSQASTLRRIIQRNNSQSLSLWKSIILSRPWYPVAAHLNALVALRRSSWPFVDNSFSFVFFRLFQASRGREGADDC